MNELTHERISALLDGEMDAHDIAPALQGLEDDTRLRDLWGRYQLISDTLRGETPSLDTWGIAARVGARVAVEPTRLAPRFSRPTGALWRQVLGGVAIAASVAMLALLLVPRSIPWPGDGPLRLASERQPATQVMTDSQGMHWDVTRPDLEQKLNNYLLDHRHYAPATYRQGVLPYASFVGYDIQR
jgi:sigma-E factor negative regulatory protein RseA